MNPKIKSTDMKLLLLQLCFNLQCLTGITFCDGSDVIRVVVGQDSDVILPCSLGNNENIQSKLFAWKKDGQEVFLYDGGLHYNNGHPGQDEKFKGRVFHFQDELKHGNASIIIRNTQVADSGDYTCRFPRLQPEKIFHIELVVGSDVIKVVVGEDSDVILPCSLGNNENITSKLFDWKKDGQNVFLYDAGRHYNNGRADQDEQFRGRVSHFQDELKHGNASIIIRNTQVADGGDYTCVFPRLQPERKIFHIELVVGAVSEPSVTTLDFKKDKALLQCVVRRASPKPKVEWKDSAGNILPAEERQVSKRGGSYDIILQTTVTKTDRYRCVVTQEDINHQTEAETSVYITAHNSGEQSHGSVSESPTGWIVAAAVLGTLFGGGVVGVLLAVLYNKGYIRLNSKKGSGSPTTTEAVHLNS